MTSSAFHPGLTIRLSVMMFLQFFTWGAWFATLGQCLGANGLGAFGGDAYGTVPLGAILAPLFLGLIADRFLPSQIVMGLLFLLGSICLFLVPAAAASGDGTRMVWLLLGNALTFMPTLGLANSIAFTHLDRVAFPKVRVWGTIGWIAAGLTVGFLGWTSSLRMFHLAAGSALALGLFSLFLPHTPAPARGEPLEWRTLLMFDGIKLLARPAFLVFMLCSMLICIPLAYYYGLTGNYLTNAGFHQAASTMTLGQMSEIFFMLLVPFFFRRLGTKWMILVGMLAWVIRYGLFAFGAPEQVVWMLLLAVALHGICYDFFFVTGFMYADRVAPRDVRSQTQSLLVFFTQGLGMFVGYKIAFGIFFGGTTTLFGRPIDLSLLGTGVPDYTPLDAALAATRGEESLTFGEQLLRMFSVGLPQSVDPALVDRAMAQWKTFWLLPAGMAAVIAAAFFLLFWDRTPVAETGADGR